MLGLLPFLLGQGCVPPGPASVSEETGDTATATEAAYAAPAPDPAIDGSAVASSIETPGGPLDVMQQKLNDAINTLLTPGTPPQVQMAAIDQGQEAKWLSNLAVLETANVPETIPMSQGRRQMTAQWIAALNTFINDGATGSPEAQAYAYDARNFEQVVDETLAVIENQTRQPNCAPNPNGPNLPANFATVCPILTADDEGAIQIDTVLPSFFWREPRGPFFWGVPGHGYLGSAIQEQVIVPEGLDVNECAVVLKEIQGVKAIVTWRLIPIWVEPWFARATIVGFRWVWCYEFVPAEFLKTISYCNMGGGNVVMRVDTRIVIERQLMHFWGFFRKDISLH
jgi:hypothetical protein